jgi:CheY-like chemotaxis protein
MHILIVEDNAADAFLTRMALLEHNPNAAVTIVDDGEPAIAHLDGSATGPDVDLIVLDLNLPRIDGLTVLQWVRENPRTAGIPVLVLSSSPADAYGGIAGEATKYVEKPGTLDEYLGIGKIVTDYLEDFRDRAATAR